MHRLKYAQYIERIEAGLKSNHRCFFKFTNLWRNSSGYPSAMFLGDTCAHNAQEIIEDIEDSSTVSLIQLEEETVERGILTCRCFLWGFSVRVEGVVRCPFVQEWWQEKYR
jgi:hypothetical protein